MARTYKIVRQAANKRLTPQKETKVEQPKVEVPAEATAAVEEKQENRKKDGGGK